MKASALPPAPDEEDSQLVKSYMLHVVLLDVLERDIRTLGTLALKLPDVYIRGLSGVQQKAMRRLTEIRQEMRSRGIRVYEENRSAKGMEALYLCRGYQRRFFMLWSYVKAETACELCAYLGIGI
ncbi:MULTISPECIES: hypothetical protein [Paenibacillus]|uniref:Uncharacterized protein n=1 Tax=Paenibacillus albilobatus TaxID=2716884 RepID=A0A920CA96_9BACL|nr:MULTISPECIES: hypothetical protein [Paenibacillus]MDR9852766.1 hypothetical protein [Paenibacillus sp. VCA1]GIO30673.1 hypothetical protein J2TS6_18140 [Paenibacillus albilobatus]